MQKRTKIVCTLGPASESIDDITKMVAAGMNVARLNFSHGTHENHEMIINNIREVEKQTGVPITILQDVQGPKIRVGKLPEEGIELKESEEVIFDTSIDVYSDGSIPVDYNELHEHVKPEERILLNDGKSEVEIKQVEGSKIHGVVTVGGVITSHKGMNVPDSTLDMRILTDKDKEDVKFGVAKGVDLIALSFVMRPDDIIHLREHIVTCEKELGIESEHPIGIIAKIERIEAVEQINQIVDVADGIMVARGDLGIEIPAEQVPVVQKKLITAALRAAKPAIVATQMLDSMQENPRPTRAEVSDVANAVIDHTDAVMLSNETSTGKYPVEAVQTMADIIIETEKSTYDNMELRRFDGEEKSINDVISGLSRLLGEKTDAKLILAGSISGGTGRLISRHRPELPIVIGTQDERVRHQLNLSWGVHSFILKACTTVEELVDESVVYLKEKQIVNNSDRIIVVAGQPVGHSGHINLLEVREIH